MNRKITRGAATWAVFGALLIAWTGAAKAASSDEKGRVKDEQAQLAEREHFYRVIAGELSGSEPGPANKLARDLRDLPVEQVDAFTGDSNRYGGITDDLGFDPFVGLDCNECGPLDDAVVEDVEEIKEGNLDEVLDEYTEAIEPADTMDGPPGFLWLLWLVSFPAYSVAVYIRRRRAEETKYREFVGERQLVSKLREAAGELSAVDQQPLNDLAERLESQIDARVSYGLTKSKQLKLESLIAEAGEVLDAIEAGNKELD